MVKALSMPDELEHSDAGAQGKAASLDAEAMTVGDLRPGAAGRGALF